MITQQLLHPLDPLDQLVRGLAQRRRGGLGGVPQPLGGLAGLVPLRVALVPDGATPLRAVVREAAAGSSFAIAVGPEGGFSDADRDALRGAGFVEVTLGPIVLRTETVCAAVLGALLVVD